MYQYLLGKVSTKELSLVEFYRLSYQYLLGKVSTAEIAVQNKKKIGGINIY